MISVFLLDNHALVRMGYRLILQQHLEVFCQGWRAEDMAKKLCLSSKTIATHKYRILEKLGIRDTIALARMAAQ